MAVGESTVRRRALGDPGVRLMLEVGEGNAAAFEELMLRYQTRLLNVIAHIVGSRDRAEDLVQEAFLRVYRARRTYKPGAKFSTWLFTIANNVAANAIKTIARRHEVKLDVRASGPMGANPLEAIMMVSSGQIPARQIDKIETREIVRLAIETLGHRQRMAVLLSKFEGMGYGEIAEELLVAYLDGELDEQTAEQVQRGLESDPDLRLRLESLWGTWAMLDELQQPQVKTDFTESTLEVVALGAQSDIDQSRPSGPLGRLGRYLTVAAGLFAACFLGFICVALFRPDPNRQLLEDLPVVQRLDEYRQIDSVEYLQELRKSELFSEDPSDD